MTQTSQEIIQQNEPEFTIKVWQTEELKSFFALSEFIIDKINIHVIKEEFGEGLIFRTMDKAHVALLDVMWHSSNFEKWQVTKAGVFAIDTAQVNKLVKLFNKKDSVTISIKDHMLVFETKTSVEKLHLLEPTEINPDCPLPHVTFTAKIGTTHEAISDIVKRISLVSEFIDMNAHGQMIEFYGKGDKGESRLRLEKGMQEVPEFELKEDTQSTFSLPLIQKFLKCVIDGSVITEFSTKMPLRMAGFLGRESRVHFYLAPRVVVD